MISVNRETEYGIFILSCLKDKGEPVSLKEIARATGFSYRFLAKAARKLKKAGILASKEGLGGGYWLKKEINKISLAEIFNIFQGEKSIVSCLGEKETALCCPNNCLMKKFWQKTEKELDQYFSRIKLSQLFKQ